MLKLFRKWGQRARLGALGEVALLADLSRRELGIIAAMIHERDFLADEIVFDEGDEGQGIYFVLQGQVLVCRQGMPQPPLATVAAGGFFGELALIDGGPRSAQARAQSDCRLGVMFRGDFIELMRAHAPIAAKVSFRLAQHYGRILRTQNARRVESA